MIIGKKLNEVEWNLRLVTVLKLQLENSNWIMKIFYNKTNKKFKLEH